MLLDNTVSFINILTSDSLNKNMMANDKYSR